MMRIGERLRDERGIAVVTALLVSMVVVILGTTSVTLAIHNSEQSAYDRRRVQNVAAAEAGLSFYYSHIQSVGAQNLACSLSRDMGTTPTTRFSATATYYNATGATLSCPIPAGETPTHAYIRSVGTTPANPQPRRVLETYVRLTPIEGGSLGNTAVYANNSFNWAANVGIRGSEACDGDVYTNGTAGFSSSTTVCGNVYAQGGINVSGNASLRRDAWANGAVRLTNNSSVLGNATSSTSSITVNNNGKIHGNARAGTSITAGAGGILGTRTPNSPQGPPPVRPFPTYTYNAASWTAAGYQISTHSSCVSAKSFIRSITSGNWVVRITGDCLLTWSRDTPTIRGHLAIISDGGMTHSSNTQWRASGGPWSFHIFMGLDDAVQPCNITFSSNSGIGTNLHALLYTPCTVSFASNSSVATGQIFGGTVSFSSNSGITYLPVSVPGVPGEGFKEDIEYIREVIG